MSFKYDERGYDKHGVDKHGYCIDGYDREGYDKEGYNEHGYNVDDIYKYRFNSHGVDKDCKYGDGSICTSKAQLACKEFRLDRDGYDKNERNFYGYDKDGYDFDGRDMSGYDKHGFNKDGVHWTHASEY